MTKEKAISATLLLNSIEEFECFTNELFNIINKYTETDNGIRELGFEISYLVEKERNEREDALAAL